MCDSLRAAPSRSPDACAAVALPPVIGAYPELFAVIGGTMPDFRGLFLRGSGGRAAALGVMQDDAVGVAAAP
jgi:hypothetical protein